MTTAMTIIIIIIITNMINGDVRSMLTSRATYDDDVDENDVDDD